MIFDRIGTLTEITTNAEYTGAVGSARRGQVYIDRAAGKKYIFLMNNAATATATQLGTRALTTDKTNFYCQVMSTTITANELLFAGARVTSATTVAQNESGWYQIGGSATLTASSDTTTADLGVVCSNQSAGQVEAAADSAAGIRGTFGIAETSTSSADVVVKITNSVWGI